MNDDTQVVNQAVTPQATNDPVVEATPDPVVEASEPVATQANTLVEEATDNPLTGYGQVPPTTDQQPATPPTQSPLDALEQILQQAKANKTSATPDVNEEAKLAEQKKQEELAKFEAQKEQQRILDAQNMAAKIAELKTVEQMPEYQARLEQDQAKIDEAAQTDSAGDGYEIEQLEHSKL